LVGFLGSNLVGVQSWVEVVEDPVIPGKEAIMAQQHTEELKREMASLRQELSDLRNRVGEVEQRLARLEVREELMESPNAAGDQAVKID
jgi:phage shock protein A